MPQIFRRSANTLSKVSIFGLLSLVGGLILLAIVLARSSYVTRQQIFVEQPLQFSHMHHVTDDGIDCRYCHTAVETSYSAGIPPTQTCMNCHSQIWADSPYLEPVRASYRDNKPIEWERVHDLPEYAYFNHSIHVAKGVGCSTCHGSIDNMPAVWQENTLQMEWCLQCHREPEKYIRPKSEIYNMQWQDSDLTTEERLQLKADYKIRSQEMMTSCSSCHR